MIFAEHLIPPDVLPSLAKSIMYGAGFICPQVLSLSGLCPFVLPLSQTTILTVTYNIEHEYSAFWQPALKLIQMSELCKSTQMYQ